jgi:Na+-transporting methylmalonyl-CoA/oxaloacetate decarboxylase gamma subunit
MPETLVVALQIAFIGMLLVFVSILMFWLLISLLVKATAVREAEPVVVVVAHDEAEQERKRRAVAPAVAAALALQSETKPRVLPTLPTPIVSAWQAVMRSSILDKRGPVR